MTTIELRFSAGRFHANPWGRHVNEGVAEWPPSPYRLLRAMYDVWQRKLPELARERVNSALGFLASAPPDFYLPQAISSHTRSYVHKNELDPTDKTLIFDAFVAFDQRASCYLQWSGTLKSADRECLSELLRHLNYLGRSESWIEARFADSLPGKMVLCKVSGDAGSNEPLVPVACAVAPSDYDGQRPWLEALTYSSGELIKDRRSAPPAMRLVPYVLPREALTSYAAPQTKRNSHIDVNAAIVSLDGRVLPLATTTLEIAEQIRVRLMGIHKRLIGDAAQVSPVFSGKSSDGSPLLDHGHVFIVPLANQEHRIDRIAIYCRNRALDNLESRAILGLRKLYSATDPQGLRCVVSWQGKAGEEPIWTSTRRVVSVTPFITVRHRKKHQTEDEFLDAEVRRECRNHQMQEPSAIRRIEKPKGMFQSIEFRRNRKTDPSRPGYAFELDFSTAVPAPFTLGYGCHYGLGQFIAGS